MTGVAHNILGRPIEHEISNLTGSRIRPPNDILVPTLHRNPGKFLEFARLNMISGSESPPELCRINGTGWSNFYLLHAEDAGNALLVRTASFDSRKK